MIEYRIGDATQPESDTDITIIAHVCNDVGKYGAGFSGALERAYPGVEQIYREKFYRDKSPVLGNIIMVERDPDNLWHKQYYPDLKQKTTIMHMIAQLDPHPRDGSCKLIYAALSQCLRTIADYVRKTHVLGREICSVHMPRIGAGLAGGDWMQIEAIINLELRGIPVYVYDLPE